MLGKIASPVKVKLKSAPFPRKANQSCKNKVQMYQINIEDSENLQLISKVPTQPSIFALSVFLSKRQKILKKNHETVVKLHLTHFYCHGDEFRLL